MLPLLLLLLFDPNTLLLTCVRLSSESPASPLTLSTCALVCFSRVAAAAGVTVAPVIVRVAVKLLFGVIDAVAAVESATAVLMPLLLLLAWLLSARLGACSRRDGDAADGGSGGRVKGDAGGPDGAPSPVRFAVSSAFSSTASVLLACEPATPVVVVVVVVVVAIDVFTDVDNG